MITVRKKLLPKVSVIIPTYNRVAYVCEAIESALAQTYPHKEIIVVADGSPRNIVEKVRGYGNKVKLFYKENGGVASAINYGLRQATGEYIAILADDDTWLPQKIEKEVNFLEHHPEYGFVYTGAFLVDKQGEIVGQRTVYEGEEPTFERLYKGPNIVCSPSNTLIRKECLDEVGWFDENISGSEDYELWMRLAKKYPFTYFDQVLTRYRVHSGNLSHNYEKRLRNHLKIFRKPEIMEGRSLWQRIVRIAEVYYYIARIHDRRGGYAQAAWYYFQAVLRCPVIGFFHWSKGIKRYRFTFIYRILRTYFLIIQCSMKALTRNMLPQMLRAIKNIFFRLMVASAYFINRPRKFNIQNPVRNLGLICYEFFHHDLGKFGGYGKTIQNITEHYNPLKDKMGTKVILSNEYPVVDKPVIQEVNKADVLFRAPANKRYLLNFWEYIQLSRKLQTDLFISIDYYETYEYPLMASPATPLLIWIRDPRSQTEWQRLATVSGELKTHGMSHIEELMEFAKEESQSLKRVMELAKVLKRKIVFVTNGQFLVERAQGTYGLPDLKAYTLMNPIPQPSLKEITFSRKPSICAIGRLMPQKRFWIIGELAKRFKEVDFYLAGLTEHPETMNPVIKRYQHVPNLKFIGIIDGEAKEKLFKQSWMFLNTSIHEGLPVTFLESFSYGKCVVSSVNPEGLVEKYGFYTGDILGDGTDEASLERFSEGIQRLLDNKQERLDRGWAAREYVQEIHSFNHFEKTLLAILKTERII